MSNRQLKTCEAEVANAGAGVEVELQLLWWKEAESMEPSLQSSEFSVQSPVFRVQSSESSVPLEQELK